MANTEVVLSSSLCNGFRQFSGQKIIVNAFYVILGHLAVIR